MTNKALKLTGSLLLLGTLLFTGGGVLVLSTDYLLAESPEDEEEKHVNDPDAPILSQDDLKPAQPYPRPDETSAMSLAAARLILADNESLKAVLEAIERADTRRFIELARKGNYCGQSLRTPLPECAERDSLEGVYNQQTPVVDPTLRPIGVVEEWLSRLFAKGPMHLSFVSRDWRLPEGNGGEYFLVFRAENAAQHTSREFEYDQLGLVVNLGEKEPIATFIMIIPDATPLQWIQELGGKDGAKYHRLIAPESVSNMPGRFGR
jgi:hypothetical protein